MKTFKKALVIIMITVFASIPFSFSSASETGGLDPDIEAVIRGQLSEAETKLLFNPANYDSKLNSKLNGMPLENYPVLRVYTEMLWDKADYSFEALAEYADSCSSKFGYWQYLVLAEKPFALSLLKQYGIPELGIQYDYLEGVYFSKGVPSYVTDIMSMTGVITFDNEEYRVEGINCYDVLSSWLGAVVFIKTDRGVLVKYYEDAEAEGELFYQADYAEKAKAYYEYITSPEHNYDENGYGLGGGSISLRQFLMNRDKYEVKKPEPSSNGSVTKYVLMACGAALIAAAAVLKALKLKKRKRV